jgi:hypothetical protein
MIIFILIEDSTKQWNIEYVLARQINGLAVIAIYVMFFSLKTSALTTKFKNSNRSGTD